MNLPSKPPESIASELASDAQIDVVCDEFEAALRAGGQPDLRKFLDRVDESVRGRLFVELLQAEFEFRPPPLGADPHEHYRQEFPSFAAEIAGLSFNSILEDTVYYDRSADRSKPRPRQFARFQLEKMLGAGAMGEVWQAYDPRLDRHIAVKIPRNAFPSEDEARRFIREGRAAAQLRHANIVQVHEVAHEAGDVYIVSEYVEGGDLRAYLDTTRLTYRAAAELCATIAAALHYAHNRGIVHRDLKPANVLMDVDGQPHLTDFGLAKWTKDATEMTATGQVLGTPAYMSPEQARGRPADVDRRSDVYALGVMLYEMLTGRLPFTGDLAEVLRAIVADPPPHPRAIRRDIPRDIPRDLATICLKAMEKDPSRRYATALDLADDLKRFLAGEPIVARPIGAAEKCWRWCKRRPSAAIALILLAFLCAAAFSGYRQRAQYRVAADIRDVVMDTEPSGAEVVYVPLNARTGLPEPDNLIRAGRSPVELGLPPGEYLVVAAHANGMFHEVPRHVPKSDEGMAGAADTVYYSMSLDGKIYLPSVKLWFDAQTRHLELVDLPPREAGQRDQLWVDNHEMVGDDLKLDDRERGPDGGTTPFLVDYYRAQTLAESNGKRLPTALEFQQIVAACAEDPDRLDGLFAEPWEWTSTAATVVLPRAGQGLAGPSELSSTAILLGGSKSGDSRSVDKYGGETAALRAVRSIRPRLRPEDFASPEETSQAVVESTSASASSQSD